MSEITEHVDLAVPVESAYLQWRKIEEFPALMSFVETVEQTTDAHHHHWQVTIGGVKREFDTEVVEHVPGERIAWRSIGGDEDQSGVVTFHRLDDASSRVTVQLAWTPEGVTENVGAALGIDSHAIRKDLANFKEKVESGAQA